MTTTVDEKVDAAAAKLQNAVDASGRHGGLRAKIAAAFEGDPAFLRKLKPSLIAARARGRAGSPAEPSRTPSTPPPAAPAKPAKGGGPSPWLVIGAAFAIGLLGAKAIDWRGHAHPRV
jgi:hypothetical protein